MIKTKSRQKIEISVNIFNKDWVSRMDEDIEKKVGEKQNTYDSKSEVYLDMLKPRWKELKKRGFFIKENTTIDNFINGNHKNETLEKYDRIPPIHQFFDKGIDGETVMDRIYSNKLDCFPNGEKDFLKMLETCEMIIRQIQTSPLLKRKLDYVKMKIEEREYITKSEMTQERLEMIRREADSYKNELDLV